MSTASPYALYISRLSPNSQRSIASQLNSVGKLMNWPEEERAERLHQVDYQQALHIRSVLTHAGWSARSINRAIIAIRGIVKVAVLTDLAEQQQSAHLETITQVKHGQHQGNPLTVKQVEKLFYLLRDDMSPIGIRNQLVFALLLGTGLRRSELAALELADYNRQAQTLFVRSGKGNKSRTLFLPPWTQEYFTSWSRFRGKDIGYLLCSVYANGSVKPVDSMNVSTIYRLIKQKLELIGVKNASPHDLRRTFITQLLEQNVDLNTVRQMAGHADISTTTIYDKRDHQFMQKAASNLSYRSKP